MGSLYAASYVASGCEARLKTYTWHSHSQGYFMLYSIHFPRSTLGMATLLYTLHLRHAKKIEVLRSPLSVCDVFARCP